DHAAPDRGARVDLDARDEAAQVADGPRGERRAVRPEIVRDAMHPERVEAWIEERDLDARARGRVVPPHRVDVFSRARDRGGDVAEPPDRGLEEHHGESSSRTVEA